MSEIWKKVTGYEDYEVSNMGRFRKGSLILKTYKTEQGYIRLGMTNNKVAKSFNAARVVLAEFVGRPSGPDIQAAHLNGIRHDNRVENLMWATALENERHKILHNTRMIGERHGMSKLRMDEVETIRKLAKWNEKKTRVINVKEVAEQFSVSRSTVRNIVNNKYWNKENPKSKAYSRKIERSFKVHIFGKNLKKLLKDLGMSQVDLATKAGLKEATITKILTGVNPPRLDTVIKILRVIPATFEEMVSDEELIQKAKGG